MKERIARTSLAAKNAEASVSVVTVVKPSKSLLTEDTKKPKNPPENEPEAALSRGQRKRQAKRDQYLRREQLVLSSLQLKREEEQRKRIDGLDAIRNALLATVQESTASTTEPSDKKSPPISSGMLNSNKARQTLVKKEAAQMSLVLQHPAFLNDPFGAIREHLTNTLSKTVEKQKAEAVQHAKDVARKEEERKARKREHTVKRKRHKVKATRSKAR